MIVGGGRSILSIRNDHGTIGAIPYAVITLFIVGLVLITLGAVADEMGPMEATLMEQSGFPYSYQRYETVIFLQMCIGAMAFVAVLTVVIFLIMNGVQDQSGGV